MKNHLTIIVCCILLTSCFFGDNPSSSNNITKDFWLSWFEYKTDQHMLYSTSEDGNIGNVIIESTVFAVGFNENFIIAKQHENIEEKTIENQTVINYYIIDIRKYKKGNTKSYEVHKLSKSGFSIMRNHLNIHEDLTFTIINTELE